IDGSHSLESAGYRDGLDGLIECPRDQRSDRAHRGDTARRHTDRAPVDRWQLPATLGLFAAVFPGQHRLQDLFRVKLVSNTRQTSSSKSIPAARAAMGT